MLTITPTETDSLMLNFDEARYVRIQAAAVDLAAGLEAAIAKSLADGARNLFFLGTGGAGILMQSAAQLLAARSEFGVHLPWAAEIVRTGSEHLGPQSLVVIPSLSGSTKESLAALEFCKDAGATVITLTGKPGTPLAQRADFDFSNDAADDTSSESYYLQSLIVALAIMRARGEFAAYPQVLAELQRLPELLLEVKRTAEGSADQIAGRLAADDYHIFTGAGSVWPQAYYYGMCILEEMQWIRTRPVHAADFFHGTLELVADEVSMFLLKGEDATRPLAERVEAFAAQRTRKLTVLDAAGYDLPGISPEVRALISPVILAAALERVSAHLEVIRDHPLTTRRYYKRVAY
jgi:fructoselysine-6-phosphate deglycase